MLKISMVQNKIYQLSSIEQLLMTFSLGDQENPEIIFKKVNSLELKTVIMGVHMNASRGRGLRRGS